MYGYNFNRMGENGGLTSRGGDSERIWSITRNRQQGKTFIGRVGERICGSKTGHSDRQQGKAFRGGVGGRIWSITHRRRPKVDSETGHGETFRWGVDKRSWSGRVVRRDSDTAGINNKRQQSGLVSHQNCQPQITWTCQPWSRRVLNLSLETHLQLVSRLRFLYI